MTDQPSNLKVCIISCVMSPEPVVSAVMGSDIAYAVAERGHDVTVLCQNPSKTQGVLYQGYSRKFPWTQDLTVNKFKLVRCFSTFSKTSSLISRFFENITFGFTSSLYLAMMKVKPDVIYINTWPIFATAMNIFVSKLYGIKIHRSVKDLYPDALLAQNRISKKSMIFKCLNALERYACGASDNNILLSEKIAKVYQKEKGIDIDYCVIRDWNSYPSQRNGGFSRADLVPLMGVDSTLMIYGGNISVAANVDGLIKSFVKADLKDTFLLIAGSGSMLDKCVELVKSMDVGEQITFYSNWAVEDTLALLSLGDVLLLPTESEQSQYSIPSKIISYMNSERPILAFGSPGCELEVIVNQSGSGWYFGTEEMVDGLKMVSSITKEELNMRGSLGKTYVGQELSKDLNLNKYVENFELI